MLTQSNRSNADTARSCLVCGHRGLSPCLEVLLRCPACGFVTARLDGPVDPAGLYGAEYFRGKEYLDYRSEEAFFKKNFRRRLNHVLRRRSGGRLLEIGAAFGFFLDLAKAHFSVIGFEVNAEAGRYARETFGVDVRSDDFLLSSPGSLGDPPDVTVMWDVIEHLERPDLFIAHIARLMRPGGLLYLTTGDIGSLVARIRGRRWRMIHPPTHLHYFSRSTLRRLLMNHGFEVLDIRTVGVARSFRQILYSILVLRMDQTRAYAALARVLPSTWGFTLNTFDIIQVVARKVSP